MTATSHSGFLRFRFPKSDSSFVVIDANAGYQSATNNTAGDGFIRIIPGKNEIVGFDPVYRIYQGWGKPAGFSGYFVIQFMQSFDSYGIWNPSGYAEDDTTQSHDRPIAYVRFKTGKGEDIEVKVGMSFTSIGEAEKNLDKEIPTWNFDHTRYITRKTWNKQLGRVEVSGGSREEKETFYTALYHSFQLPRVISNVDSTYVSFDSTHAEAKAKSYLQYGDYSLWDTFRAEQPLLTLLEPDKARDMIVSLVKKGEQGGYLPIFPAWDNYTSEMIGDHAIPVIADAYMKGIRNFDADSAYALMKKNATERPASDAEYIAGKGRRALGNYIQYGFVPLEDSVKYAFHHGEQVSRTLEYSYDDWALSQMAKALGKKDDYKDFSRRGQYFRNVFDSTGFVRGRYTNGAWAAPFRPNVHYPYITEGTSWQYSWFVPQDIPALIQLMGGRTTFVNRLDTLFEKAVNKSPGFRENPYYWQGNEPDQLAPYLYDYAGQPWKTQYWVRQIMKRSYLDNAGGLPGNDDAGQMSAWYVFSAMGFYPVCPGKPVYAIGSPLFNKVVLHLKGDKTFTIIAKDNSNKNMYIQSARMNGKKLNKPLIKNEDILDGGTLELQMGPEPNRNWGAVHK